MIKIKIPLPPITKKNSQQIRWRNVQNKKNGKMKKTPYIAPSEAFSIYESKVLWWYMPKMKRAIDFPVNVKCLFYMPTKRKCDLTNLLEAVDDILVNAGVLADDNYTIIESHDGSRVYYDKDDPRTEIYITEITEKETPDVTYICDLKKCKNCSYPTCTHTTDIRHAVNFENKDEAFCEKIEGERKK